MNNTQRTLSGHCNDEFLAAVAKGARRTSITISAYVLRAVLDQVRRDKLWSKNRPANCRNKVQRDAL